MKKNFGMLALIMAFWFTISFITNILGPLIPDIIHNFNLSDLAMAGFIPTSFFIAYAIMSVPAGLMIDRFGEKPVLFLGFLLDFAARRPRWQAVGEAVFSFGLLFEGIDILGRALQPLAGQTVFLDWMTRVKESPLLGILLGLSMTMVVQSSSATIALLQNVARQAGPDGIHSVLGLAGAVPVLLGDNIGTTVTALLACIGQGKNAARAALAHSCFNLSGSLLAAVLLPWFVRLVELISPKGPELEVISRQIANAHTAFNVCCALLWLPFLPWMVRLVCALVPEDR